MLSLFIFLLIFSVFFGAAFGTVIRWVLAHPAVLVVCEGGAHFTASSSAKHCNVLRILRCNPSAVLRFQIRLVRVFNVNHKRFHCSRIRIPAPWMRRFSHRRFVVRFDPLTWLRPGGRWSELVVLRSSAHITSNTISSKSRFQSIQN